MLFQAVTKDTTAIREEFSCDGPSSITVYHPRSFTETEWPDVEEWLDLLKRRWKRRVVPANAPDPKPTH